MKVQNLKIEKLRCFEDFGLEFPPYEKESGSGNQTEPDEDSKLDRESEVIFVAGENGSGKSTILWAVASIIEDMFGRGRPNLGRFSNEGKFSVRIGLTDKEREISKEEYAEFQLSWQNGGTKPKWINGAGIRDVLQNYRKDSKNADRNEVGTLDYLPPDRFVYMEVEDTLKAVQTGEIETRSNLQFLNVVQARERGRGPTSKYKDVLRQYGTLLQEDSRNREKVCDQVMKTPSDSSLKPVKEFAIKIQEKSHYKRIEKAIAKYLPGVRLGSQSEQTYNPPRMVLKTLGGESIGLAQLSSGEFQIVVWLVDLIQKDLRNSIILWDEPEQHLHPSLAMKIPSMLRELCPGSQIWFATQSPFVLSTAQQQDHVIYLERDVGGTVNRIDQPESKMRSFRKLTPNAFLATWGKQIVFVEGKTDVTFFQRILDELGLDALAAPLLSKPSIEKLNSILEKMREKWEVPIAVAVVDRDYYEPRDFDPYPLVTYYSEKSCDLEGLLLEPRYLEVDILRDMARTTLETEAVSSPGNPIGTLINHFIQDERTQKELYRYYFRHQLAGQIGWKLRDKPLNINKMHEDAAERLQDIMDSFLPSLSLEKLPFTYPDILKWCKGKYLLPRIGDWLGMRGKKRIFATLSSRVVSRPPKHLVEFLKRHDERFTSQ